MRKRPACQFQPLGKLKFLRQSEQTIELNSSVGQIRLGVLADDLFRLRITAQTKFSSRPSWAVDQVVWPPVAANFKVGSRQISIGTASGIFRFSPQDGAWNLSGLNGEKLFEAGPNTIGFAGKEGRVQLNLSENESLFGLGEATGTFNKRGLIL